MYEELVKSLKICGTPALINEKCIAFHDGCCEAEPVCMYELMRKAADAIEELQGRAKVLEKVADKWCEAVPQWIPVTERLPKEDETVMTWGKQEVVLFDWLHDNRWCCFGEVIYWMPLPEPPKEGE